MTITLIHGGQTGVDRGAYDAAVALGLPQDGYAPRDARDEDGIIPPPVLARLRLCGEPGYAARTRWNVGLAAAVLVIVADPMRPYDTPGTRYTLEVARGAKPTLAVGPDHPTALLRGWLAEIQLARSVLYPRAGLALMVAGPRASKWPDGARRARDLLVRILEHPSRSSG